MNEMREVLGAPEWYLAADLQTTSFSADQQCVTFVIHFMGKSRCISLLIGVMQKLHVVGR